MTYGLEHQKSEAFEEINSQNVSKSGHCLAWGPYLSWYNGLAGITFYKIILARFTPATDYLVRIKRGNISAITPTDLVKCGLQDLV